MQRRFWNGSISGESQAAFRGALSCPQQLGDIVVPDEVVRGGAGQDVDPQVRIALDLLDGGLEIAACPLVHDARRLVVEAQDRDRTEALE